MGIYVIKRKAELEKELGIVSPSEELLKLFGVDPARIWYQEEINKLFDKHSKELIELFEDITGESFIEHLIQVMPAGEVLTPEEALQLLLEEARRGPQP